MAGREVDPISAKADNVFQLKVRPEDKKVEIDSALQDQLRSLQPTEVSRLLKALDKIENKSTGDNLEIVETRDGKVVILTGKDGEALVGTFKK